MASLQSIIKGLLFGKFRPPQAMLRRLSSGADFVHINTGANNAKTSFEFNAESKKKIGSIMTCYPEGHKQGAMIALLHLAQQQNQGWLPISAMNKVASMLGVDNMRVYEVATFYTMFKRNPIGKYHVQVCTCTPCWLRGSGEVLSTFVRQCGVSKANEKEISKDGLFSVSEVECLGACCNAPMVQINDSYYEDLKAEHIPSIVKGLRDADASKTPGQLPRAGPQSGRRTSEPSEVDGSKPTSLINPPYGPGFGVRPDL